MPERRTLQSSKALASVAARETPLGLELIIAVVMRAFDEMLHVAADAFLGLAVKDSAKCGKVACSLVVM